MSGVVSGAAVPAGSAALVGRVAEVARLRELAAGVAAGQGGAVWVEGEPGIGKSSVLAAGLADVAATVFWGTCDELGQRLPLRVLTAALGVDDPAADPGLAAIAGLLNRGTAADGWRVDAVATAVPAMVDWVESAAAQRPLVLVVDDAQWADEASLLVIAELARLVGQLPVLVAVAARPVPRRAEVVAARRAVTSRGGAVLRVGPLPAADVAEMVGRLVGGRPGPALREAAAAAGGNPLYVRELVDALVREQRARVRGETVELSGGAGGPVSLADAISDRLAFLSETTLGVLRLAAVLGSDFSVPDLSTVVGRAPSELVPVVQEAVAAGVLAEAGRGLRFRHGLIRHSLAESMPAGLQSALHAQVARALMAAGAGVQRIAEQLLAVDAGVLGEGWVLDWLVEAGDRLVNRAPDTAAELLHGAREAAAPDDPRREELAEHLLAALVLNWRLAEVEQLARRIFAHAQDPDRVGAAALRLIQAISRDNRWEQAVHEAETILSSGRISDRWAARLRAMYAIDLIRVDPSADSEAVGAAALADGERTADRFTMGHALLSLAFGSTQNGDHAGAADRIRRALDVLGDDLETMDLRMLLMSNYAGALHYVDRPAEAQAALSQAVRLAEQASPGRLALIRLTGASMYFEWGAWDDVLTELDDLQIVNPRYQVLPLLLRARIALHRGETAAGEQALAALRALDGTQQRDWAAQAALHTHAAAADHAGDARELLAAVQPLLHGELLSEEPVHSWWLPLAVTAALTLGETATAVAVEQTAAAEATRNGTPSMQAIAAHCRGLLDGDAAAIAAAAAQLAAATRPLPAGRAYEDAAVAHAAAGKPAAARTCVEAALAQYSILGAEFDIRRATSRVRRYGVRTARREPRSRPTTGWAALTPAETKVADLLRAGRSNPDIAAELFLSRRTVESHVARILTKLGAKSRMEVIAATRTPASPASG
ncbi:MAG TPA: AAA family ATPase [Mycobacteriales bacterium]|nr:AAA family ATPase [Mycobacteriales bacterium]